MGLPQHPGKLADIILVNVVRKLGFRQVFLNVLQQLLGVFNEVFVGVVPILDAHEEIAVVGSPELETLTFGNLLRHSQEPDAVTHVLLVVSGFHGLGITLLISVLHPFLVFPVFTAMAGIGILVVGHEANRLFTLRDGGETDCVGTVNLIRLNDTAVVEELLIFNSVHNGRIIYVKIRLPITIP